MCLIFGCKKVDQLRVSGFTKYSVSKGGNSSTPIAFQTFINNCNINASAYFTEKSKYNLVDVDQFDWNKLDGFKLDLNSVPNNSALIGWRYNVVANYFEIAPYFNNNGLVLPDNNEILTILPNEIFTYNVKFSGKKATISITKGNITITKTRQLKSAFIFPRVSLWFGGNKTAPNNLEVFINR